MCFSAAWLVSLLVWLIVLGAVVAVLRILVPWALSLAGIGPNPVLQVLNIVIGVIIVIALIYFFYDVITCVSASDFGPHPRLR